MATCTALTALELACQMDKMKITLRKKDKQLLAASEKVCDEFMNLNMPVHGEVSFVLAFSTYVPASGAGPLRRGQWRYGVRRHPVQGGLAGGGMVVSIVVMVLMVVVQGYINVDALDEDMPTLRKLEGKQLYRNYIWREVDNDWDWD
jgi:hypothetical protein